MLRRVVTARGGLVWGRGGDSALCVWRVSKPPSWRSKLLPSGALRRQQAEHEARLKACLAALEIRDAIDAFNARHPAAQQLPTRIGLDAGEIGLGPVGGELQAVGNPANAASRIEGLNKHLGTKLLASAAVVRDQQTLAIRRLGRFILPGKADEIEIVELVATDRTILEQDRRLCDRFEEALARFESSDWAAAGSLFRTLAIDYPADGPAHYYRDVCDRFAASPPPGGRPVIRIDAK
jgi:adenylate cyclase